MKRVKVTAALLAVAVCLAAGACSKPESETDKKLAEMQKQLDETKKQLDEKTAQAAQAATEVATDAAKTPAAQAEAPAAPAPQAAAASKAPAAPKAAGAAAGPAKAQPTPAEVKDQEARAAAAANKAAIEQHNAAIEKQKGLNAQQAQTNQTVQRQIEELKPREFTLPAGAVVPVRTTGELSTKNLSNGSTFEATLERDLVVEGVVLAKQGALVRGYVVSSDPGGKIKGVASMKVGVRAITGVDGAMINVKTDSYEVTAKSTKGKDATRTGIMTGVGAAVGAIAGGGKGAAIGAGAGAAGGLGVNAATKGQAAVIEPETLLELKLTSPATVVLKK